MAMNGVKFFSSFDKSYKYKNDGLPYGPSWDVSKIAKHLESMGEQKQRKKEITNSNTEPIYEESINRYWGMREVVSPYVLVQDICNPLSPSLPPFLFPFPLFFQSSPLLYLTTIQMNHPLLYHTVTNL
jgi:hypothetical protein